MYGYFGNVMAGAYGFSTPIVRVERRHFGRAKSSRGYILTFLSVGVCVSVYDIFPFDWFT